MVFFITCHYCYYLQLHVTIPRWSRQAETCRHQWADRYEHPQAESSPYRIGTLAASAKPELAGTASCPLHSAHGSTRPLGRTCRELNVTLPKAGDARH